MKITFDVQVSSTKHRKFKYLKFKSQHIQLQRMIITDRDYSDLISDQIQIFTLEDVYKQSLYHYTSPNFYYNHNLYKLGIYKHFSKKISANVKNCLMFCGAVYIMAKDAMIVLINLTTQKSDYTFVLYIYQYLDIKVLICNFLFTCWIINPK